MPFSVSWLTVNVAIVFQVGPRLSSWPQSYMQPPPSFQQQVYASQSASFPQTIVGPAMQQMQRPQMMSAQSRPHFATAMPYQQPPDSGFENSERRLHEYDQTRAMAQRQPQYVMSHVPQTPNSQGPQQGQMAMVQSDPSDQRMTRMTIPVGQQLLPAPPRYATSSNISRMPAADVGQQNMMPLRMNVVSNSSFPQPNVYDPNAIMRGSRPRMPYISMMRQPNADFVGNIAPVALQQNNPSQFYRGQAPVQNLPPQPQVAVAPAIVPPTAVFNQQQQQPAANYPMSIPAGVPANYVVRRSSSIDNDSSQNLVQNFAPSTEQLQSEPTKVVCTNLYDDYFRVPKFYNYEHAGFYTELAIVGLCVYWFTHFLSTCMF